MWRWKTLIEFIDKTSERSGTPLNRENLMAVQGFLGRKIQFMEDGSIVETNDRGHTKTTTFSGNKVVEVFKGEKTITKTTTFNGDRSITEVIS